VDADTTTDVVPAAHYEAETLRNITSFEDALAVAGMTMGKLDDAAEVLGDGFALLRTDGAKAQLVGKPMVLLEWSFYAGDFGDDFAAIRLVVKEPNGSISKYIVNDGSTGVAKMLKQYSDRTGRNGGLVIRNGFRESTYTYCQVCASAKCEVPDIHSKTKGNHIDATTYYIDTSL